MTSEDTLLSERSELRIVLVGKVGAGKTSVRNTFLRSSEENERPASYRTEPCPVKIGGQTVVLVDTPGLCSAEKTDEKVMEEIKHRVSLAAPGPHVFLFVLSCLDRFTEEEQDMVKIIKETFGENTPRHSVVLFTCGDQLKKKGKPIEEFIKDSRALKGFVDECNGGYHVFDNRDQDPSQVTELLEKISVMVQKNGGECYAADVLEKAEEGKEKNGRLKKRIAVSTCHSAVAGAAVGGVVSHFVGDFGSVIGATAGGVIGGTAGGAVILAVEHIKHAKGCIIQ